jgi:hypothetical protein
MISVGSIQHPIEYTIYKRKPEKQPIKKTLEKMGFFSHPLPQFSQLKRSGRPTPLDIRGREQ